MNVGPPLTPVLYLLVHLPEVSKLSLPCGCGGNHADVCKCTCVFTSLHTVMASLLHLAAAAVFLNPVTIIQWKEHLFVCLFFETPSCLVSPMGLP